MRRTVRRLLRELGAQPLSEHLTDDGCLSIDLAIPFPSPRVERDRLVDGEEQGTAPSAPHGLAVEVNGPSHYASNNTFHELGRTILRRRLLEARGWRVVSVPHYEVEGLPAEKRKERLRSLLKQHLDDSEAHLYASSSADLTAPITTL